MTGADVLTEAMRLLNNGQAGQAAKFVEVWARRSPEKAEEAAAHLWATGLGVAAHEMRVSIKNINKFLAWLEAGRKQARLMRARLENDEQRGA